MTPKFRLLLAQTKCSAATGLGVKAFCRMVGISYPAWRKYMTDKRTPHKNMVKGILSKVDEYMKKGGG